MANARLFVDHVSLEKAGAKLINVVKSSKETFYINLAKKINDPSTSNKTYCTIIKTFINGKQLLLSHHYWSIIASSLTLWKRLTSLKNFFVQQLQSIANNRPRDFDIGLGKILKLINALNPRIARGHDGISIRMHKLFNLAITKPLSIIYKNCLQQGVFPDDWKNTT